MLHRRERQVDADHVSDAARPEPAGIDHVLRDDHSLFGLDEPTVGVDPQSRDRIYDVLADLRSAGVSLLLTTHHLEEAEALCEQFRTLGRRAVAIKASVSQPDSVGELFTELRKHFEHLDIVISNAASGVLKPALDMTLKHWRWCMETNAFALNLLAQRAVPIMGAGGRIIAMSSLGSVRAMPHYAFIGASNVVL